MNTIVILFNIPQDFTWYKQHKKHFESHILGLTNNAIPSLDLTCDRPRDPDATVASLTSLLASLVQLPLVLYRLNSTCVRYIELEIQIH